MIPEIFSEEENQMIREVFESAMSKIEEYSITKDSSFLYKYTPIEMQVIKESMIVFYEGAEEYEKCKKIKEFFETIESTIKLGEIIGSTATLSSIIQGVKNAKQ
jgi:RNA-splicing ligase RtcB